MTQITLLQHVYSQHATFQVNLYMHGDYTR